MELTPHLIRRFYATLPGMRDWMDELLKEHARDSVSLTELGFNRLEKCYERQILETARVVMTNKLPQVPFNQLGLPEFANALPDNAWGVTFKDTYFIMNSQRQSESLHFHELVHIVQWQTLGVDHFLLAYGVGLATKGYLHSPLEEIAYKMQAEFEQGKISKDTTPDIRKQSAEIWTQVISMLGIDYQKLSKNI